MKKRFFSLLLLVTFAVCSCYNHEENANIKIINAENMEGVKIEIETETKSIETHEPVISSYDITNEQIYYSEPPDTSVAVDPGTVSSSTSSMETTASSTEHITTESKTETTAAKTSNSTATQTEPITSQTTTTTAKTTALSEQRTITENTSQELSGIVSDYKPLNYKNVIGVWISYIELSSVLKGKNETSFRKSFSDMMDNCSNLGINTVFIHLRPFGDAFYKSELFPWSSYVTGTAGKSPGFDPLSIMLEEAHSRDISFHGWINPLRINSASEIVSIGKEYATGEWYNSNKKGDYLVKNGDYWYMNPAYDSVIDLISDGAYEIVSSYDVDGLHIDDYFYPTTDASFDKSAFDAAGLNNLSDFRFNNISKMVKNIYNAVKNANPNVQFGISPQGSVDNNYNYLYADVRLWCGTNGYCDYIAPQIYYGFDNAAQPFAKCLSVWHKMTSDSSVKVIPGLAVYKVGKEDTWAGSTGKNEWINNNDILKRQIEEAREYTTYSGIIFYSYNHLFNKEYVTKVNTAEINAMLPILK